MSVLAGGQARTNARWLETVQYLDLTGTPINITGWSLWMQLRTTPQSTAVVLDLTVANGRLVLSAPVWGQFDIDVPKSIMATVPPGLYYFDIVAIAESVYTFIGAGTVVILQGVTR